LKIAILCSRVNNGIGRAFNLIVSELTSCSRGVVRIPANMGSRRKFRFFAKDVWIERKI